MNGNRGTSSVRMAKKVMASFFSDNFKTEGAESLDEAVPCNGGKGAHALTAIL